MDQSNLMKTAEALIYLVSCAINREKPDREFCAKSDLDAVFEMARKHRITAAAAFALKEIMPLPPHWKEAYGKAMRNQAFFDMERAKVLDALEANGIWYLPLKGIILKNCYPKSSMREMTDNDILYDASHSKKVHELMKRMGYTCTEYVRSDDGHDVYVKPPSVSFELHRALMNRYPDPPFFHYYQAKKDLMIKDENRRYAYHMSHNDFYVFHICRMFKHYSRGGTGLRSLTDTYVHYREYGDRLDRVYLEAELEKLGLSEFERKIRCLSDKVFRRLPLEESETRELEFFVKSGCYGTSAQKLEKTIGSGNSKSAKYRYILRRIFPPREALLMCYPVVYRHMILYPLMVVYRLFKSLIKYPGRVRRELRRVRNYRPNDSDQ